jgi:hypothetical protein
MLSKILLVLTPAALFAFSNESLSWQPAVHAIALPEKQLEIALNAPLPDHWALTFVAAKSDRNTAFISASAVTVDGPFVDQVRDLEPQRIFKQPGAFRIDGLSERMALAVCVTVPAGTEVRILHDGLLVVRADEGVVVDGTIVARAPKVCGSIPPLVTVISH